MSRAGGKHSSSKRERAETVGGTVARVGSLRKHSGALLAEMRRYKSESKVKVEGAQLKLVATNSKA
jgi:hypothetical protein